VTVCWQCRDLSDALAIVALLAPIVAATVEGMIRACKLARHWAVPCSLVAGVVIVSVSTAEISPRSLIVGVLTAVTASGGYSWVKKWLEAAQGLSGGQTGKGGRDAAGD
jgi:hypothetical protein